MFGNKIIEDKMIGEELSAVLNSGGQRQVCFDTRYDTL